MMTDDIWRAMVRTIIATQTNNSEKHPEVEEAARRCCEHIVQEIITIRYAQRLRSR